MLLGNSQEEILKEAVRIILKADYEHLLKELDNQLIITLNNYKAVLRVNIFDQNVRSFNLFKGDTKKTLGNLKQIG